MVKTLKHKGVGMGTVSAKTKKRVKDELAGKKMELYRPFIVEVREVHIQKYEVSARTADEAMACIENGEGEIVEGSLEYSHMLDKDTWSAAEKENTDKKGKGR